eukprot:4284305-Amphidinium_carterae.1
MVALCRVWRSVKHNPPGHGLLHSNGRVVWGFNPIAFDSGFGAHRMRGSAQRNSTSNEFQTCDLGMRLWSEFRFATVATKTIT